MTTRHHSEDGSAPLIEIAIGAPVILIVIWLVIWAATGGQTPGQVRQAAQDAARLASTVRTANDRPAAATRLVDGRLAANSDCTTWTTATTSTDTAVTVTVTCQLDTDQMAALNLGTRTTTETGRAAIDPYFLQD